MRIPYAKLIFGSYMMFASAARIDDYPAFVAISTSFIETYFIKMYIYRLQEKYDQSLEEINKAVKEGNEGYIFYAEMIKRKKNDR